MAWTGDDYLASYVASDSADVRVVDATYAYDGNGQRLSASVTATSAFSPDTAVATAYTYAWEGTDLAVFTAASSEGSASVSYLFDEIAWVAVGAIAGALIGGGIAYYKAKKAGKTGWALAGSVALGALDGGMTGASIATGVGAIGALAARTGGKFALKSAGKAVFKKLAGSVKNVYHDARTLRELRGVTRQAVRDWDDGVIHMTGKQAAAAARRPGLARAFRGERIDARVRVLARENRYLGQRLNSRALNCTPRGKFGPDFYSSSGKRWYDMTTRGQWSSHKAKYNSDFGRGTRLRAD